MAFPCNCLHHSVLCLVFKHVRVEEVSRLNDVRFRERAVQVRRASLELRVRLHLVACPSNCLFSEVWMSRVRPESMRLEFKLKLRIQNALDMSTLSTSLPLDLQHCDASLWVPAGCWPLQCPTIVSCFKGQTAALYRSRKKHTCSLGRCMAAHEGPSTSSLTCWHRTTRLPSCNNKGVLSTSEVR